jgi:hypothetical protein
MSSFHRYARHLGGSFCVLGLFAAAASATTPAAPQVIYSCLSGIGPCLGRPPLEGAGAVWLY